MARSTSSTSNLPLALVLAVVLVAAVAVALLGGGGGDDGFDLDAVATPAVTGQHLPDGTDATTLPAPVVTAERIEGSGELTLPVEGSPTLVVFLAHWCPHCDAEVPVLEEWVAAGGLPAGVEVRAVATAIDPLRADYPPTTWLEEHGFTLPTVVDTDGSIADAYGVTGYPGWALVGAQGEVLARAAGPVDVPTLDRMAAALEASA